MRLTRRSRRHRRTGRAVVHVVKRGETYKSIAERYGLSWDRLYAYNTDPNVVDAQAAVDRRRRGPNLTYVGEWLAIPGAGYRPAAFDDERYLLHRTAWERTGDPEELELMLASLVLADDSAWPTAWPLR